MTATWYLNCADNRLDAADYENQTGHIGAKIPISGALSFIGTVQYDWMKHPDTSGKRPTTTDMFNYALSKHTSIYAEVDYTRLQGAWVALNGAAAFNNSGNTYNGSSWLGTMLDVRHKF